MERYIGTKIVLATPLMEKEFVATYRLPGGSLPQVDREGYLVIYEDGYTSWSPKETFERAYRRVTELELNLLDNPGLAGRPR